MWKLLTLACLFLLFCSPNVQCRSKKKQKQKNLSEKEVKDNEVQKVSSSKVPNGGRKGPTSGNLAGNLHISPVSIPFPVPKKVKGKKGKKVKERNRESATSRQQKNKKKQPRESDNDTSRRSNIEQILDSEQVVARMRRDIDEEKFSEEERKLIDDWFNMDVAKETGNIPSRETASFVPPNLRYIYETDAYNDLFAPQENGEQVRVQKRSIDVDDESDVTENDDDVDLMSQNEDDRDERVIEKRDVTDYDVIDDMSLDEEDVPRDMRTREISPADDLYGDEVMDIVEESGFTEPIHHTIVTREAPSNDVQADPNNVNAAAKALDNILVGLGINEDRIIEQTRECIQESLKERRSVDQQFRRHIIHARQVMDEPVHRRSDIIALKRSLEDDQAAEKNMNEKIELCNDIIMNVLKVKAAEWSARNRVASSAADQKSAVFNSASSSFIESAAKPTAPINSAASISELKSQYSPMVPSVLSQAFRNQQEQPKPAAEAAPMFTTITLQPQQPVAQPVPVTASFVQSPRPITQLQESHEIGMQRHFDNAPNPSNTLTAPQPALQAPSVLNQPHLVEHFQQPMFKTFSPQKQYNSQPLAYNRLSYNGNDMVRQNYQMFHQAPPVSMMRQNYQMSQQNSFNEQFHGLKEEASQPIFSYFKQKQPAVLAAPAPVPSLYAPVINKPYELAPRPLSMFPQENMMLNRPIMASYANERASQKPKLSHPDHHHSSTESNENKDKEDWSSSLWFPGGTYSPPPSWLKGQKVHEPVKEPYVPNQPTPQQTQPQYQQNFQPVVPFIASPAQTPEVHPAITQIAGEQRHIEGQPGVVAPFSSLKPYNPFTQERPAVIQQQPDMSRFMGVPAQQQTVPPAVLTFASPQNSAHEVIKAGPQNEVQTINKNSPSKENSKAEEDHDLPGYLGAMDIAKYPLDSTDRLRGGKGQKDEEQAPKRENVINPKSAKGVEMASHAVKNIGTTIGLGDRDINTLVDHVSKNVREVRSLCEKLVHSYDNILKHNCSGAATDSSSAAGGGGNSAQKSELDKRSEIKNTICENLRLTRDTHQTCVANQEQSINEVNAIESTIIGVKVAEFAAAQAAASTSVGA